MIQTETNNQLSHILKKPVNPALSKSLAGLGLSRKVAHDILLIYLNLTRKDLVDEDQWLEVIGGWRRNNLDAMAEQVTVGEIITPWEEKDFTQNWRVPMRLENNHASVSHFLGKVAEHGVTRLEWILLPQRTLDPVTLNLSKLSKDEIVELSVLVLGADTLSHLRRMEEEFGAKLADITIRQVLTLEGGGERFKKTAEKLRLLGFSRADGPFMPPTKKEEEEDLIKVLMERHRLNREQVELILNVAKKEEWIL